MLKHIEKRPMLSWSIVIFIAIVIFYVSSLTFQAGGTKGFGWKAIAYHFSAFFLLSFFLSIAITKGTNKKSILIAINIAILYGLLDELHQAFVPGRYCSIGDVALNTIGITFAGIIYLLSIEYRLKKKSII